MRLFFPYPLLVSSGHVEITGEYNGGFLPNMILTVDQMLLPSGNPIICHEKLFAFAAYDPT